MSSPTAEAISPRSVADWPTVGSRLAYARKAERLELRELAARVGIDHDDLRRQEAGDPVLDSFDLQRLAAALRTTTGALFYDDRRAMFRGEGDNGAAAEAEEVGRRLMAEFLAIEAVCG
jgi:transcriptional regulator with XRE-family HTH domain